MKLPPARELVRAKPGEVNYGFVDRFTLVHFGIGLVYGLLHLHLGWALLLAIGWELVENILKARVAWIFPHATADTWKNSLGDVLAVMSGWALMALT